MAREVRSAWRGLIISAADQWGEDILRTLSTILRSFCAVVAVMAGPLHADAIDDYVNQEIARERTPGAALAIMQHGALVRAQGYGFANLEHRAPVHPETIFQSGSIGKQFTSTAIMLMVEDGRLKLDESIRTYLPESPKSWQPIRLRHLLTHTSGLAGDPGFDMRRDYDDAQMLKILYGLKLDFPAGQRWSYSNSGYALLGLLIKRVSGEFYGDVLAKRVFAPLHMETARIINEPDIVMNRAAGYEIGDDDVIHNQAWVSPTVNTTADGSLYLTVLDFVKWDAGLRAGQILKPQSWAEVYKPVVLTSGKSYPYGFGWDLEEFVGQPVHAHGGSWQGFRTYFIRYLDDEISIAVLTNSDHGNPERIARIVAGLYHPKLALPPGAPIEDRDPALAERVKALLAQLAQGKLDAAQFVGISTEDTKRVAEYYSPRIKAAGALQELRLFSRKELGDDVEFRYRARFANGIMDVGLTTIPSGKLSYISVTPADTWDAPLIP
jgi:CubicO group peptidase (beta-lactamase class C family)